MKPWIMTVIVVVWLFLGIVATFINEAGGEGEHSAPAAGLPYVVNLS